MANISSNSTFFLLIDELDEGYHSGDKNINLVILSLLRATDELYHLFHNQPRLSFIPILALRSDIFDRLEDNDLNKIDDFVLRLNRTTIIDDPWSLKRIAEKRIAATIEHKYPDLHIENCWSLVADEKSANNGLWQHICTITFSRPRDIIKFLKYCAENLKHPKLTLADIQSVEQTYSDWFYREFRDEVQSFLSCWSGALNCISKVAKGKERTEVLLKRFESNESAMKWCNDNSQRPIDVLKILFDYSVIGCINDSGRWIFKYKDDYFDFMPSYPYYRVHFGFCRKLRIPRSYDRTIIEVYQRYK